MRMRGPAGSVLAVALCWLAGGLAAAGGAAPEGDWAGWVYFDGGGDAPLRLGFRSGSAGLEGTIEAVVSANFGLPLAEVGWEAPVLRAVRVTGAGEAIVFDGELRDDTVTGRVDWAGTPGEFWLHRSPRPLPAVDPASYAGCQGTYRLDDGTRLIVGSRFWGELLYTDLGTGREGTLFAGSANRFFAGPAMYVPGPVEVEATFERDAAGEVRGVVWRRAGEPRRRGRRVGFVEEPLVFESSGVRLTGTLIRPARDGPFPAIVVLGGSNWRERGALRRDAAHFAAAGLAVLTYDKRGFGESAGEQEVPFETTARDALAAIGALEAREDIVAGMTGLAGRSRGGWFAPLAASLSDAVDFLVLFVPPAVSPARQETTRRLNELRAAGHSAKELALARRLLDETWRFARTGEGWERYAAARRRAVAAGLPELLFETADPDPAAWRWMRMNMHHDPRPALERVRVPVLALFGERDRNVVPDDNLPVMRRVLVRTGNRRADLRVVPGAGHSLNSAPAAGGEPLPLHMQSGGGPEVWPAVLAWLDQLLRDRPGFSPAARQMSRPRRPAP